MRKQVGVTGDRCYRCARDLAGKSPTLWKPGAGFPRTRQKRFKKKKVWEGGEQGQEPQYHTASLGFLIHQQF